MGFILRIRKCGYDRGRRVLVFCRFRRYLFSVGFVVFVVERFVG